MIRWLRFASIAIVGLTIIGVGVGVGLFLTTNDRWEDITLHAWLTPVFGDTPRQAWLPALMAGWLVAVLAMGILFWWSLFYVWRRRQAEAKIARLERELMELRNLPFEDPAPFEDIEERPDARARDVLMDLLPDAAPARATRRAGGREP